MKAVRIFYKSDRIIWTHGLEGPGVFHSGIGAELMQYPEGTRCIEICDEATIESFLASDENYFSDDILIIGQPRPSPLPTPEPRDLAAEVDNIKKRLKELENSRS